MKIVLHCTHRSGSTALTDYIFLKNKLNVNLLEPFINLRLDNFDSNLALWLQKNLEYKTRNDKTRIEYIENNISAILSSNKSFIFKIIPTQIQIYPNLFKNLKNTQYHFLYREDILDCVLSRCLAESRNIFNFHHPIAYDNFECKESSIISQVDEYVELRKVFHSHSYDKIYKYEDENIISNKYVKLSSYKEKKEKCLNFEWAKSYILDLCNKNGFADGKFYI